MEFLQRRGILKSAGALGTILLAPKLPMWSLAEAKPLRKAPPDYLGASSALLGVPESALDPILKQDDISLADVYYGLAEIAGPDGLGQMLSVYRVFLEQGYSAQEIGQRLLSINGDGALPTPSPAACFSRLTMLQWLFGVWYGGTEVDRMPVSSGYITDPAYRTDFIVSGRAYKSGWIWRIAQSHPMGFSQFNFGSWASVPPSLDDYGISAARRVTRDRNAPHK
jgi:hypothetical protein